MIETKKENSSAKKINNNNNIKSIRQILFHENI